MMKRNVSRGRLIFSCVWLGIFAVAYILWAFYLSVVSGRLAEYESLHPEHEANRVFTEYFLEADAKSFASYDSEVESKFDIAGSASEYFYSLTYGKQLSMEKLGSSAENSLTYSVCADGSEFARFTLTKEDSPEHTFGVWALSKITLTARPAYVVRIIAPKTALVTVNGVLLDSGYAVSEYMLADAPYFGGNAEARVMVEYRISGLYSEPTVAATYGSGSVKLGLDKEGNSVFSAEKSFLSYLSYLHYGK